jgi:hypothetical protein
MEKVGSMEDGHGIGWWKVDLLMLVEDHNVAGATPGCSSTHLCNIGEGVVR